MKICIIEEEPGLRRAAQEEARRSYPRATIRGFADERQALKYLDGEDPSRKNGGVLRVRCFGDFTVSVQGRMLPFRYSKTKELLAYLIDRRGAMVSNAQIQTVLWESDRDRTSYFKQIRKDLLDTLQARGCGDVILRRRGYLGVHPQSIDCDYFEYLKGSADAMKDYHGEYMHQYSWAEITNGHLQDVKISKKDENI